MPLADETSLTVGVLDFIGRVFKKLAGKAALRWWKGR